MSPEKNVGVVIIGRNEGERLKRCISSMRGLSSAMVYVDSGSTDGSAEWARAQGVMVVDLDLKIPFTAARARNEGFAKLTKENPEINYVQFVDGDCEVVPDWLERATAFLGARMDVAVVCGRRRERYPGASIYNQLCDYEWDTPIGSAKYCGGDALFRLDVLKQVGGFRADLIAGEEPELCVRIRQLGKLVWRLDAEMTLHDSNIQHFSEWFNRTKRCGYAYVKGLSIHGFTEERFRVKETLRTMFWGFALPVVIIVLSIIDQLGLALALIYPIQVLRLNSSQKSISNTKSRFLWALYTVAGKFPEFFGIMRFVKERIFNKQGSLIEYK